MEFILVMGSMVKCLRAQTLKSAKLLNLCALVFSSVKQMIIIVLTFQVVTGLT